MADDGSQHLIYDAEAGAWRPETERERAAREMAEAREAADRQMREALDRLNLSGIADQIGKATADVARQLGLTQEGSSPYIKRDVLGSKAPFVHMGIGAGLSFFALMFLAASVVLLIGDIFSGVVGLLFTAAVGVPGIGLIRKARRERRLYDTLSRVSNVLDQRERIPLAELSGMVGVPAAELEPLMGEAIARGLIPHGHLGTSARGKELFLAADAWRQELEARSAATARAAAPHATAAPPEAGAADGEQDPELTPEVADLLRACVNFNDDVRGACARIKDPEASGSLESIASRVVGLAVYVRKHPETASRLHRLITYYLPTTKKLAVSYAELEQQGDGPQAASTRAELKETFALIDDALAKFSDDLLQSQSWDLKSDMDVLRTMLKQDGLSNDDAK